MFVVALLKFSQGALTVSGQALIVTLTGGAVTIENDDNTGVKSWRIELLYGPPGSSWDAPPAPGTPLLLAENSNSAVPTAVLTPDAAYPGCYRVRLTVWGLKNFAGVPDIDIRNFALLTPFSNSILFPYQKQPDPLPLTGAGAKDDELNFDAQPFGWGGDSDTSRRMLNESIKLMDSLVGLYVPPAPADDKKVFFVTGGGVGYSEFLKTDGLNYIAIGNGAFTMPAWGAVRLGEGLDVCTYANGTTVNLIGTDANDIKIGDTLVDSVIVTCGAAYAHQWVVGGTKTLSLNTDTLTFGVGVVAPVITVEATTGVPGTALTISGQNTDAGNTGGELIFTSGYSTTSDARCGALTFSQGLVERLKFAAGIGGGNVTMTLSSTAGDTFNMVGVCGTILSCVDGGAAVPKIGFLGAAAQARSVHGTTSADALACLIAFGFMAP